MSLNEEVEALLSVPLFAKIEPSKLKLLAFTSERLTFPAGQELFHQGDPGDAAYIILDGQADVVVDTPNGEFAVAKVGKNDFVGEIAILIDVPRTATIRAETELTTLAITKDLFWVPCLIATMKSFCTPILACYPNNSELGPAGTIG